MVYPPLIHLQTKYILTHAPFHSHHSAISGYESSVEDWTSDVIGKSEDTEKATSMLATLEQVLLALDALRLSYFINFSEENYKADLDLLLERVRLSHNNRAKAPQVKVRKQKSRQDAAALRKEEKQLNALMEEADELKAELARVERKEEEKAQKPPAKGKGGVKRKRGAKKDDDDDDVDDDEEEEEEENEEGEESDEERGEGDDDGGGSDDEDQPAPKKPKSEFD
jgi:hypothetical protein